MCCLTLDHLVWFTLQQEQVIMPCDTTVYKRKFHITQPLRNVWSISWELYAINALLPFINIGFIFEVLISIIV